MLSHFSHVQLFAALWTAARQAPLSMGFSTQEYWSGLPYPLPGPLPEPGIEPGSPAVQADSLSLSHRGSPMDLTTLSPCSAPCGTCFVIVGSLEKQVAQREAVTCQRPHAGGRQPQDWNPWAPLLWWRGGAAGPTYSTDLPCPPGHASPDAVPAPQMPPPLLTEAQGHTLSLWKPGQFSCLLPPPLSLPLSGEQVVI